ncbi:MAG: ketose-bisphosphate aldolase [Negativicutes bacterium]
MALVSMREILNDAQKRKYAVGGFNVFNFETLGAVGEVAEELKAPIVLGVAERLFKFVDVETLSAAILCAAKKSAVPVALHLDHAHTYEGVMKAIRWGFTSVMFDGSAMSLTDNLKRTKEISNIAHSLGISVEGELGYINCYRPSEAGDEENLIKLDIVADFVAKTKIDALAIAANRNHGVCKNEIQLDFARLSQLSSQITIPLVMHGGSKLRKEDYRDAIQAGISKINIATDMSLVAAEKLKSELAASPNANYVHLMSVVKKGVKDSVRKYMLYFDCISKAM